MQLTIGAELDTRLRVLVVGGGFIGEATARAVSGCGHHVTVVTRAPAPPSIGSIEWRFGHARSSSLPAMIADSDVMVLANGKLLPATDLHHLAGPIEDELIPLVNLAESAADAHLRRLVFISSGGTVYGPDHKLPIAETAQLRPINPYGALKVMMEQALLDVARRKSLPTAILRVSNPYGRRQVSDEGLGFIGAAIRAAHTSGQITIWGDGSAIRDFVHIDDAADAIRLACERELDSFVLNIGSGVQCSLLRIIELVEKVSGRTISPRFEAGRKVDVPCNALDITRAATILGWHPSTSLQDGIRLTLGEPRQASSKRNS